MTQIFKLKKTEKQSEAMRLMSGNKFSLLEGGSRSGKTIIILYAIILRALKVKSQHVITKFRFAHAKQSICFQSMPFLIEKLGLKNSVKLNKTDWFYQFENGSLIWITGLDDKERTEKILGNEYATIYFNESSQISYNSVEIMLSRLNPPSGLKGRVFFDYNPPSKNHWGYKIFHDREFPDGRKVPDNDYRWIKINPVDNQKNLSPDYLDTLGNLSIQKRKRFMDGEYSVDEGSLFKREWIRYANKNEYERIVIGVDPSGTSTGNEIGIIVSGLKENKYYVLDDYSLHGKPAEWATEISIAYHRWKADIVVAEKNYGGDMVEHTIKSVDRSIPVKLITSSRGKKLRAEPISALYDPDTTDGCRVFHREPFYELEDEMCAFKEGESESPNRLDALVFSITELSGAGVSMLDVC